MKIVTGNIFSSKMQTIVNPINCEGAMGAGLALEFRLRYPVMNEKYISLCKQNKIDIGILWIYKNSPERWILNFPTKKHWKYPTKTEYLKKGLEKFVNTYDQKDIQSIAFPILGSDKGGLSSDVSMKIMDDFLSRCTIPVEIYKYDPALIDPEFLLFKKRFFEIGLDDFISKCNIQQRYAIKLENALHNPKINSLSSLCSVKGVGIKTVEKAFTELSSL